MLAKYLLEVAAFDLTLRALSPSLVAYGIVFFIKKLRAYSSWEEEKLRRESGVSDTDLRMVTK